MLSAPVRHLSGWKFHPNNPIFQVGADVQLFDNNLVALLSSKLVSSELLRVSATCQQDRPADALPLWVNKICVFGAQEQEISYRYWTSGTGCSFQTS